MSLQNPAQPTLTLKKANRISIPIDGTFGNVSFPIRWAKMNDRFTRTWTTVMGTLPKLAKVSFTAGEILRLHFPAVGSQLDSLNQPGVHHGKLI
jgi:hypothetical protein